MGENYITVVNPHFQDSTPKSKLYFSLLFIPLISVAVAFKTRKVFPSNLIFLMSIFI